MCIYFTVLFTIYKCHCVNMLCSPLLEENKISISNMYRFLHGYGMSRAPIGTPSAVLA